MTEFDNLMLAHEGFIRRAALLDAPFMLKGSLVTRQYMQNPNIRIAQDLDWVYLEKIETEEQAAEALNNWVTAITEMELNDGIKFRSFSENTFWRRIDYAMNDDFPTVNTDLLCWVFGEKIESFGMDVSWNLDIPISPIPLKYCSINENDFILPLTCPLALQISWKLHQTLVRPRFKDLFDLIHLLQHPDFDEVTKKNMLHALANECFADNISFRKTELFFNQELRKHEIYKTVPIEEFWNYFMDRKTSKSNSWNFESPARWTISDISVLPQNLNLFLQQFENALLKVGLTPDVFYQLPYPTNPNTQRSNIDLEPKSDSQHDILDPLLSKSIR